MSLGVLILLSIAVSNLGDACLTSSDEYAVEIVVPDYNLGEVAKLSQIVDRRYMSVSQYNPNLLVIAEESSSPQGLSVRLQLATEKHEIKRPYLKVFSAYSLGTLKGNIPSPFLGWRISCFGETCNFKGNDVSISARQLKDSGELTFEITKELAECTDLCTGGCLLLLKKNVCIDRQTQNDIDRVLKHANITEGASSLFSSYRVGNSEGIVIIDLIPSYNFLIDWREAMREELVFLRARNVIKMSNEKLEQAVVLAVRGHAGDAYRIVQDSNTGSWTYANRVPDIVVSTDRECKSYSIRQEPSAGLGDAKISFFYLVPLILGAVAVFLFLVLIIVANYLRRKRARARAKHAPNDK